MSKQPLSPPMVLFDSNSLVKEQLLTSFTGASLVELLTRRGGKIVLPDIVKREAIEKLERDSDIARNEIADNLKTQGKFVGKVLSSPMPSKKEISTGLNNIIESLKGIIIRAELSFDQCKSALERIFLKRAPCGQNNEQFRDACIWQDCLDYVKGGTLIFITNDMAFYDKRNKSDVSPDIIEDIRNKRVDIQVVRYAADALALLSKMAPPRNLKLARKNLNSAVIKLQASERFPEFLVTSIRKTDLEVSVLDTPSTALLRFKVEADVEDQTLFSVSRTDTSARIVGSARLDLTNEQVSKTSFDEVTYRWVENGQSTSTTTTRYSRSEIRFG